MECSPLEPAPATQTIAVLPFANCADPAGLMLAAASPTAFLSTWRGWANPALSLTERTAVRTFARPSLKSPKRSVRVRLEEVRNEAGHISIQVVLVDASLDRKVWVHDVGGTVSDIPEMQRQIAQAASAAVLQRKR